MPQQGSLPILIEGVTLPQFSAHCLPVKFRIEFKILLLVFKCVYGLAPNYLQEQITIRNHQRHSLRSTNKFLLDYPKGKMLSTLGEHAFISAAPRLWNALSIDTRSEHSLCSFKTKLKTFLFKQAFSDS